MTPVDRPAARVAGLTTLVLVSAATGAQISWTAPGDGSFHDASNWSPETVPGPNDLVVLDQSSVRTTITFSHDVETMSLELFDGLYELDFGGHTYELNSIAGPLNLSSFNDFELTLIDGTLTAQTAFTATIGAGTNGDWRIGQDAAVQIVSQVSMGGNVALRVEDGGAFAAQSVFVGIGSGDQSSVWMTTGGQMNVSGTVWLPQNAGADADVYFGVGGAGTRLEADTIRVGNPSGSTGRLSITEFGEAQVGTLRLGEAGTAEVGVHDGGMLDVGAELYIGDAAELEISALGEVDVDGTGIVLDSGLIHLQTGGTLRTPAIDGSGAIMIDAETTIDFENTLFVGPGGPLGSMIPFADQRALIVRGSLIIEDTAPSSAFVDMNDSPLTVEGDVMVAMESGQFGDLIVRGDTGGSLDIAGDLFLGIEEFAPNTFDDTGGEVEFDAERGTVTIGGRLALGQQALADVKPGATITASEVISYGNLDMQGGLLLVGDQLPPDAPLDALVVNGADGPAVTLEDGQLVTPNGLIGTGEDGNGTVYVYDSSWFCAGPLEVGRADGAGSGFVLVAEQGLISSTGDFTLHPESALFMGFDGQLIAPQIEINGGYLGDGELRGHVVNGGTIIPVESGSDPEDQSGVIRVLANGADASYEQTASGTLEIMLVDVDDNAAIEVNGPVHLAGTLKITLGPDFEPAIGDGYEIVRVLDAGGETIVHGTFDAVEPANYEAIYLNDAVLVRRVEIDTCPFDFDGTGAVGFNDLALLLGNWGPCPAECPWDVDGSGSVGFNDLALQLGSWGECP